MGIVKSVGVGEAARLIAKGQRRLGFAGLINQGIKGGGLRAEIAGSLAVPMTRAAEVQVSDIISALGPMVEITVDGKKLQVMQNEVTVGLFARFVNKTKHEITGHNAEGLKALIADPTKANATLYYVSFDDGVKFIDWLKEETGKEVDFLTKEEFLVAKATGKLKSKGHWNWVKDFYQDTKARVLLSVNYEGRDISNPELRYDSIGLRLVDRT